MTNGRSVKVLVGGFPVLRLTAFQGGRLTLTVFKEGECPAEDADPWLVKEGDFFAARGNGSKHLVGTGAPAPQVSMPVAYPDTMIRLSVDHVITDRKYFSRVWNSRVIRNQIENAARNTAGICKINQPHINGFCFRLRPREEQSAILHEILPLLSSVEHSEAEITTALATITALRQAALKKAFLGQLVAQDPSDEPAATPVARLKAEASPSKTRRLTSRKTAP